MEQFLSICRKQTGLLMADNTMGGTALNFDKRESPNALARQTPLPAAP